MNPAPSPSGPLDSCSLPAGLGFIGAGTPMRDMVRTFPWETTALGPVADWSASLRTAAGIVMHSAHPMFLWWGPQLIQIYNDGYVPCFGHGKHPAALGQPGRQCWPEIWHIIGPQIDSVLNGGPTQWYEDNLVPIWRNGKIEDVYWSYTYTPVFGERGAPEGVLVVCTETTAKVLAARRRTTLDAFNEGLRQCRNKDELLALVLRVAEANPADIRALRICAPAAPDEVRIAAADLNINSTLALCFTPSAVLPFDQAYRHFLEQYTGAAGTALLRIEGDATRHEIERLNAKLNQSLRAKDEFLAVLGHELRNPLAPIVSALELMRLKDNRTAPEQAVMQRQLDHLVRLVDDLLDVSRITSGKVELRMSRVKLDDVLAKAVEMASPLLERRRHHLEVDVPGVDWYGDPARLAQVVSNLLNNAGRYTAEGGRIALRARTDADLIHITVTDNGQGIAADLLPVIFDLFVQGARRLDNAQGGLGVGLALVKNLVQMHGGHVGAASDGPGTGSTFTITLPRAARLSEASQPAPAIAAGAGSRSKHLLVVDDNKDAADALGDILRMLGHSATVVYTPASALAAAREQRYDTAILDIGLPGMDGYQLAGQLRPLMPEPAQLVALTGYGQASDRERSKGAGFNFHLVKPIDLQQLRPLLD